MAEVWAFKIARHQDEQRILEIPELDATETVPRARRHSFRGEDPDSQREI